jgi:hypothetical protein
MSCQAVGSRAAVTKACNVVRCSFATPRPLRQTYVLDNGPPKIVGNKHDCPLPSLILPKRLEPIQEL